VGGYRRIDSTSDGTHARGPVLWAACMATTVFGEPMEETDARYHAHRNIEKGTKVKNAERILTVLFVIGALFAIPASPALAHRGHVFGPSFGAPGSGSGELSLSALSEGPMPQGGSGLAVNEITHDVYVADTGNHRVDEFTSTGTFVRAWGWGVENGASEFQICTEATGCRAGVAGTSPGEFESPAFVAVDGSPGGEGDVYVSDYQQSGDRLVQKFTEKGDLIESWGNKGQVDKASVIAPESLGRISGIAVAPSGELLVGTDSGIFEFNQSSGTYIARLAHFEVQTEFPNGFAVDHSGNVYYQEFNRIRTVTSNGTLGGEVFEILTSYVAGGFAVAKSGELFVDEGNAIQVISSSCVSLCAPLTTFSSPELTNGAGLAVDSQLETVYIAETAADKIDSIIPEPPAAPIVEAGSESVSAVSADSAILEATVNPRSEANEEPTSYRFQYTTEESYQREGFSGASTIPIPDSQLPANFEADLVTAHPQGLQPDTVYHYRLVAENAISRKEGKPTEGERNEAGEEIVRTFTTQAPGVFALPDGRAWELVSPPNKHGALIRPIIGKGLAQASTNGDAITYLASAPTEPLPPGNSNYTQVLSGRGGAGASAWESRDISTSREVANGFNEGGAEEYRFFTSDLALGIVQPFGAFVPSISAEASEQTAFLRSDFLNGDPTDPCVSSCYRPLVTGAPGVANVPEGFEFGEAECRSGQCGPQFLGTSPDGSHIVLTSGLDGLTEGSPARSLYEWAGGRLQLVSVMPKSEGGQPAPESSAPQLGGIVNGAPVIANAVSADGSRVVWSTNGGTFTGKLYMRDTAREETVLLSGEKAAEFQASSSDDSRVFFTAGGDLYVFEAPPGAPLTTGHATDLTPGAEVQGLLPGAAEDGSSVYFVANGALTGSEANEHGEVAVSRQPNLYVYHAGTTRLVAVLSNRDDADWIRPTARVAPDGDWLAFMSERSLTGYDNRDISRGGLDEEVFLYHASANGGRGQLVCASCNPTGARPHGVYDESTVAKTLLADGQQIWAGQGLAANIPGRASPLYVSRYLSNSGRLFFNGADALVPSDTNGVEDVYEYEPPGVGGCTSDSAGFSSHSDGCVGLVSSGTSKEESAFLDASESGDDVFFLSAAQLSRQDTDSTFDVYDARVGGGFPESQPPPTCEGDACQSPVAAPNDPTPGSLTYQGPGNPVPPLAAKKVTKKKVTKCAKGKKLSHGKCVKVRKRKKAAKSSNRRRTK
jgi:hypothetical protein